LESTKGGKTYWAGKTKQHESERGKLFSTVVSKQVMVRDGRKPRTCQQSQKGDVLAVNLGLILTFPSYYPPCSIGFSISEAFLHRLIFLCKYTGATPAPLMPQSRSPILT
jgi:hypothetical protein